MQLSLLLSWFYERILQDSRIAPTHISLYLALVLQGCREGQNPVFITRREVMKRAKIHSRHTYNKRMKELQQYGFLRYIPSRDPQVESSVHLSGP